MGISSSSVNDLIIRSGTCGCGGVGGVTVWVDTSALGLSVVSTVVGASEGLSSVVSTIEWLFDLLMSKVVVVAHGGASLVAWAHLVSGSWSGEAASTELSIASRSRGGVLWLSLPELALAIAGSVVVLWRWAVTLLLLVVADQGKLHGSGDQEQECGDDADGEADGVVSACGAVADLEHGVVVAVESEVAAIAARLARRLTAAERSVDIA